MQEAAHGIEVACEKRRNCGFRDMEQIEAQRFNDTSGCSRRECFQRLGADRKEKQRQDGGGDANSKVEGV